MLFLLINFLSVLSLRTDSLNLAGEFGKFQSAVSVSSSREEFIFVSDILTNQIYKFSGDGVLLQTFGGTGSGNYQLNTPLSVEASNGLDVFVADYQNNRVQRYDIKLHYVATFDFNLYNLTTDISKQIYHPSSIAFLNTSEIFVLADAGNFKAAKLKSFDDVSLLFGSTFGFDRIVDAGKIIRGSSVSLFILDKRADEILNFDNFGTLLTRMRNPEPEPIISIAFYNDILYILTGKSLVTYDMKRKQFGGLYSFAVNNAESIMDCTVFSRENFLLLSDKQVYKFKIK